MKSNILFVLSLIFTLSTVTVVGVTVINIANAPIDNSCLPDGTNCD